MANHNLELFSNTITLVNTYAEYHRESIVLIRKTLSETNFENPTNCMSLLIVLIKEVNKYKAAETLHNKKYAAALNLLRGEIIGVLMKNETWPEIQKIHDQAVKVRHMCITSNKPISLAVSNTCDAIVVDETVRAEFIQAFANDKNIVITNIENSSENSRLLSEDNEENDNSCCNCRMM